MNIVISLIILIVLVVVHEFGHFFAAKSFGIRVDEFGFGFGYKLFSFRKGETEYSFNLFPLGGFVKIFGENPETEQAHSETDPKEDVERSFQNKAKWKQAIVLFAGVFMNFILAWILFSVGLMSGLPTSVGDNQENFNISDISLMVTSVSPDSPAEVGGLTPGDVIVRVASLSPEDGLVEGELEEINPNGLKAFILAHPDRQIEVGYQQGLKNSDTNFTVITPVSSEIDGTPIIGISMDQVGIAKLPFLRAFWEGMRQTLFLTKGLAVGLYGLILEAFQGNGSLASVVGPVGIVGIVGNAYALGFVYLLSLTAFISVNLVIVNLLPLPVLDGGRLFILLVEKIKGSALNPIIIKWASTGSVLALILLMLFVTYHDVVTLF